MASSTDIRHMPDPAQSYWNNVPVLHVLHEHQRGVYESYRESTGAVYDPKTVLMDELSAWRYWISLQLTDLESDTWAVWAQVEHDPGLNWERVLQACAERDGKQYHFNRHLSRPPRYWILQEIDKKSGSILEMWSIAEGLVVKCSTVHELLQPRLQSLTEHLSSAFQLLSGAAPHQTPQGIPVWQSSPMQRPEPEASGSGSGSGSGNNAGMQIDGSVAGGAEAGGGGGVGDVQGDGSGGDEASGGGNAKKKGKTQRQQAFDFALAAAFDSMTKSLPRIENPSTSVDDPAATVGIPARSAAAPSISTQAKVDRPKTREEEELDRLMRLVNVDPAGRSAGLGGGATNPAGTGASGASGVRGEKRSREEAGGGGVKQARFAT